MARRTQHLTPSKDTASSFQIQQLTLQQRIIAATGASVLSALVVNPLDVVKVRMQAQAAGNTATEAYSAQAYCFHRSIPVRSMLNKTSSMVSPLQALHYWARLGWMRPKMSASSMAPTPCLCAAPGIHVDAMREMQVPAVCSQPAAPRVTTVSAPRMLPTLRLIMDQEGLASLWRGLDSALLMSVPTVLLYYPMYDSLMAYLTAPTLPGKQADSIPRLGPLAPVVAGAMARTVTVFAVAPLEYVRVRQQASPSPSTTSTASRSATAGAASGGLSAWQTLRSSLTDGAAGVGQDGGVTAVSAVARALPRLWTGLSATIARDVPFSAIYWGLVEPIRSTLLTTTSTPTHHASTSSPYVSTSQPHDGPSTCFQSTPADHQHHDGKTAPSQQSMLSEEEIVDQPGRALTTQMPYTAPPALSAQQQAPATHTHAQLLLANLVAGSLAGAAAAAATTPFDVVKTRLQLATPSTAGRSGGLAVSNGMWAVMGQVVQEQGVKGLFVGVGPRAARCAPACAIVIACYELLKNFLSTHQQVLAD